MLPCQVSTPLKLFPSIYISEVIGAHIIGSISYYQHSHQNNFFEKAGLVLPFLHAFVNKLASKPFQETQFRLGWAVAHNLL